VNEIYDVVQRGQIRIDSLHLRSLPHIKVQLAHASFLINPYYSAPNAVLCVSTQ
jgi:hypothetical protein